MMASHRQHVAVSILLALSLTTMAEASSQTRQHAKAKRFGSRHEAARRGEEDAEEQSEGTRRFGEEERHVRAFSKKHRGSRKGLNHEEKEKENPYRHQHQHQQQHALLGLKAQRTHRGQQKSEKEMMTP